MGYRFVHRKGPHGILSNAFLQKKRTDLDPSSLRMDAKHTLKRALRYCFMESLIMNAMSHEGYSEQGSFRSFLSKTERHSEGSISEAIRFNSWSVALSNAQDYQPYSC